MPLRTNHKWIAVDIGNSGLRAAELDVALESIGSAKRIYWQYESPKSDVRSHGLSQTRAEEAMDRQEFVRFPPDSPEWLNELTEFFDLEVPTRWLVSTVRRDAARLLAERVRELGRSSGHEIHVMRCHDLALRLDVSEPNRVGIDRLLASLAASEKAKHALQGTKRLIVIQAGSAVTVDLVAIESGVSTFLGGAILPGVPMMLRLLGKAADMLPTIDASDLIELPSAPGKDTVQAMLLGAASSLVGGVIHLVERYRAQETG